MKSIVVLQKSIPALQPKGAELYTIPGLPPDLSKPLPGCPFVPRCEFARDEICLQPVTLREISPDHGSACTRVQRGEIQLNDELQPASVDEDFIAPPR